ncbi:MAG: 3-deoxy-D-manno-octulosonic acid transferase [Micavibrio sp.]|nr:3-deoxy-D-manno-octulosonic acid transferase [Micavibrio sp.]
MLKLYKNLMKHAERPLDNLLEKRLDRGKELPERIQERKGIASIQRPDGKLYWVHAASNGEAQSALILINALLEKDDELNILITTGTVTSAKLMQKNLPKRAIHQFYPLDVPKWCKEFIEHWKPDLALWMESELWPNMLQEIKSSNIPAALINARLSPKSYNRWKLIKSSFSKMLACFHLILCQNDQEATYYSKLGGQNVHVTDNLKYSARPLPHNSNDLTALNTAIFNRPVWLYASTHRGEEELAANIHKQLKAKHADLLTIIVPRHPERGDFIYKELKTSYPDFEIIMRSNERALPQFDTDIYLADTLGELGLFYRSCPIACIGRSFSDDGGGGHNPIEAAKLHCAIMAGPHVQNLQEIYDEIYANKAAINLNSEADFVAQLDRLLSDKQKLEDLQARSFKYANQKANVLERVMEKLEPILPEK